MTKPKIKTRFIPGLLTTALELSSCGQEALSHHQVTPFLPQSHPGLYEVETGQEPLSLDKGELPKGNKALQMSW